MIAAALVFGASTGCKKKPVDVKPNDEVQCCFLVPYEGLNGQTISQPQCRPEPVCAQSGQKDTKDVCEPLACKVGAVNPYGMPGPGGAITTVGDCVVDYENTIVVPDGCADGSGGRGAGTDQPAPPPPAPGEGSGADSTGA